jgi:hypothetical protein
MKALAKFLGIFGIGKAEERRQAEIARVRDYDLSDPEVNTGPTAFRGNRSAPGAFGKCHNHPGPQQPSTDPRFNHALRRFNKKD